MNVYYFISRWPRYNESARADKILSMVQTLLNIGNNVSLISADPSPESSIQDIQKMPVELIYVNPNKINNSLTAAAKKPDIALFNSPQMQEMYSIFLYSKWNKCPRILQLNRLQGLDQWRKANYQTFNTSFIHQYDAFSYPSNQTPLKQKFSVFELQSILRSDYYFCGNDFISNYLVNNIKTSNYILHSMGVPIKDFQIQLKQLTFRQWRHRDHFAFLGNLTQQKNISMINTLINGVWPLIRKQLKNVELHIYGSGYNKNLQAKKKQLQKQGIFIQGYLDQSEDIQKYRALLYPVQYSSGTKGAFVESWFHHTPIVTTPVGAEGMFLETSEPRFSASQTGQAFSGFFKQRVMTKVEESQQIKLKSYYNQNKLSENINNFKFGGLCNSFSLQQFAINAINIYTNEQLWNQCLSNSRTSLLKHQSQLQLQVNLGFGISQVQLAVYQGRRKKQYIQQWDRYLKSREGSNRLSERKQK